MSKPIGWKLTKQLDKVIEALAEVYRNQEKKKQGELLTEFVDVAKKFEVTPEAIRNFNRKYHKQILEKAKVK